MRTYAPLKQRENHTYFTTDNFTDVYQWYAASFDLGPEQHALSTCVDAYVTEAERFVRRNIALTLCYGEEGNTIYIMRQFDRTR